MDTPIYIDTYFRVESGYDGGRMPEEKAGRFFDEVKRLFTETGFSIKENKYKDGCPEVYLGKTCLYCHPQSLSGPVLKEHMELIEKILAQGTTFRYLRTDTYGEILDLTEEEELAYYHKTHDMTIGGGSFSTPSAPSAGTCTRAGSRCWKYSSKSCVSRHSVGSPFIRTPPRHTVISGKCTGKWCLKDGSSRDASKPLPGNCRSAARQPAGN